MVPSASAWSQTKLRGPCASARELKLQGCMHRELFLQKATEVTEARRLPLFPPFPPVENSHHVINPRNHRVHPPRLRKGADEVARRVVKMTRLQKLSPYIVANFSDPVAQVSRPALRLGREAECRRLNVTGTKSVPEPQGLDVPTPRATLRVQVRSTPMSTALEQAVPPPIG